MGLKTTKKSFNFVEPLQRLINVRLRQARVKPAVSVRWAVKDCSVVGGEGGGGLSVQRPRITGI